MVLYFKKQNLYNLLFAFALICAFSLFVTNTKNEMSVSATPVSGKIIVIDAGHGSPDGGASGRSGVLEKDINLSIAKKLGNFFQQSGAYVVYTREDDNSIADNLDEKLRQIKRSDMKNRKEIRDNSNADVFISIHMNAYGDSHYSGAQVFYQHDSSESKKLAESIQQTVKSFADSSNTREVKDSQNSIFLLNNSQIPSVLVECGFLSNEAEEAKLKSNSYQEKIAYAIYGGVLKYINS